MAAIPALLLAISAAASSQASRIMTPGPTCEPIKIDMCISIGYNHTGMPNLATNPLQSDAKFELESYSPLIQIGCANELQFFLCSVYVPMCVNEESNLVPMQALIGPCRPLCERVKKSCLPLIVEFGLSWPHVLNCSNFPSDNDHNHMCMEGPGESHTPLRLPPSSLNTLQTNPFLMEKVKEQLSGGFKLTERYKNYKKFFELFESNLKKLEPAQGINVQCGHLKKSSSYQFIERTKECVPECSANISFTEEDKDFAWHWVVGLSMLSLFLSLVSLVTLVVDNYCSTPSSRMTVAQFAHRAPPLFFTLCCSFCSFGFLLSQLFTRQNFCLPSDEDGSVMLAAKEGHRSQPCVLVFLLVYFFGTSASSWWTVTAFSWFLAVLKANSGPGGLSAATFSTLCHLFAWVPAAVLTVTAILTHQVESDELTSLCLPGALDGDSSVLVFVLIPEAIQMFLGVLFYVMAVVAAFLPPGKSSNELRSKPRKKNSDPDIVKKLRARVGIFGILYTIPKLCSFVTIVYEYMYRSLWLDASQMWLPKMEIFMLRIFMTLFVGMSCLWWIWRREVVSSWANCCSDMIGCWRPKSKADTPPPPLYPNVAYHPQSQFDNAIAIMPTSNFQR